MPTYVYETALDSFTEDLNRALRAAGSPSYTQLQQVSERLRSLGGADRVDVLTRSNTSERLTGRRLQPPPWPWVRSYVTVLHKVAEGNGISPESVGALDEWKQKYDVVRAAADQAGRRQGSVGRHRKQDSPDSARHAAPHAGAAGADPAKDDHADDRDAARWGEVLRLPPQATQAQWRYCYRGMAPESLNLYTNLESVAEAVRTYEPEVIPALLQVEAYAHATLTNYCPDASTNEITRLVELRMRRQVRLCEPQFRLWAVIDEAALRSRYVNARAMRSQITHLINMAEEANVTLRLMNVAQLPGAQDHIAIKEPVTHFRFPEEHVDDVVFIERPPDGVILRDRKETAHYSRLMSRLGVRAARAAGAQDQLRAIFVGL
jgi:hypothetical protein